MAAVDPLVLPNNFRSEVFQIARTYSTGVAGRRKVEDVIGV
jgi:hypothetical protein